MRTLSEALQRYTVWEGAFNDLSAEGAAYWLGFLYADGNICAIKSGFRLSLGVAIKDRAHLEEFRTFIRATTPVGIQAKGHVAVLQVCNNTISKNLIGLGVVPRKSLVLTFPNFVPETTVHHFMRGYFDGDGSVSIRRNKSRAKEELRMNIVGTNQFLRTYSALLSRYCGSGEGYLYPRGEGWGVLNYGGNRQVQAIYSWLYKDAAIYLERKREIFMQGPCVTRLPRRAIKGSVYFVQKMSKWRGRVRINGIYKGVGYFATRDEAISAIADYWQTQAPA